MYYTRDQLVIGQVTSPKKMDFTIVYRCNVCHGVFENARDAFRHRDQSPHCRQGPPEPGFTCEIRHNKAGQDPTVSSTKKDNGDGAMAN